VDLILGSAYQATFDVDRARLCKVKVKEQSLFFDDQKQEVWKQMFEIRIIYSLRRSLYTNIYISGKSTIKDQRALCGIHPKDHWNSNSSNELNDPASAPEVTPFKMNLGLASSKSRTKSLTVRSRAS
jgi:hypothetical protein